MEPTREKLLEEIKALRARVAELEHVEIELKQARTELDTRQARLQKMIESMPIVLYSAEAMTNRIHLLTGAVRKLLGHDAACYMADPELGSRNIHPEDGNRVYQAFKRNLETITPFERKMSAMSEAMLSSPPGLLRRSSISPSSTAPFLWKSAIAARASSSVLS